MRKYRLLAGLVALLIVGAGVLSVTAGGTPALPPPVTLRGQVPDSTPHASDGLEFVPPTLADLGSTIPPDPTTTTRGVAPPSSVSDTADSPTVVATADSPDVTSSVPATAAPRVASPASPDSADSPDD